MKGDQFQMAGVSAEASQKIKNMSVICAMLVVTIHVGWTKEVICPTWFINELVAQGIARIAVPFFFVVSGFFLAAHFDEDGWWARETKKRIRSLVVPFFVWNLIPLVVIPLLSIVADLIAHRPFGTSLSIPENPLGFHLDKGPTLNGPLWYVRCLIFFVLLSPVFKVVVRRFRLGWLIFAFIVTTVFSAIVTALPDDPENRPFWSGFFRYGISLSGIFYFSVGICLRRLNIKVRSTPLAFTCAVYGVGILLLRTFARSRGMELPVGVDEVPASFGLPLRRPDMSAQRVPPAPLRVVGCCAIDAPSRPKSAAFLKHSRPILSILSNTSSPDSPDQHG